MVVILIDLVLMMITNQNIRSVPVIHAAKAKGTESKPDLR